jgi:hypothetical protein
LDDEEEEVLEPQSKVTVLWSTIWDYYLSNKICT